VLRFDCASKMAAGTIPASFISLRRCDSGLGFGKNIYFVRVSDLKRMNSARRKVSIIRSSNPSQDIAELQPASKGSQLLGMNVT
jgi:(E)-4-hydroxy-3-methylbut-2-enyl-diphosphate synthase